MPELYIHIGLPKTATTYLQSSYFPQLMDIQFYGKGGRRYFLDLDSYDAKDRNILISQEEFTAQTWTKKRQIRRGETDLVRWADTFEQAIANLKRIFPTAHILVMFRRQGDFIVSLWRSHVMMGGVETFSEYFGETGMFHEEDILIEPKVQVLRREFGENVTFFSFEDFKRQGPAYLDGFFASRGMLRNPAANVKRLRNASFRGSKLEVTRRINFFYFKIPNKFRVVLNKLRLNHRILFQRILTLWDPPEEPNIAEIRRRINERLADDYSRFETHKFVPPGQHERANGSPNGTEPSQPAIKSCKSQ